jgi:NAD(P)-dependent dehydrogenase (short-subunit alcohol dehydrogenase family)
VLDINLTGVWLCMKYEIPKMLERGGGAVVNVSSILGQVGFANAPAYTSAKHGVLGLTKVAAIEYAAQGVRVTALSGVHRHADAGTRWNTGRIGDG